MNVVTFFKTGRDQPVFSGDPSLVRRVYERRRWSVFLSVLFGYGLVYTSRMNFSVAKKVGSVTSGFVSDYLFGSRRNIPAFIYGVLEVLSLFALYWIPAGHPLLDSAGLARRAGPLDVVGRVALVLPRQTMLSMNQAIACAGLIVLTLPGIVGAAASDAGRDWGVERQSYVDPVTGITIWELTKPGSASDNLYFHFSNFTADNRYLVFVSDRTGSSQLFRAEVETGRLVQLTDDPSIQARSACLDHTEARRLFYLRGPDVFALDILDFSRRKIGEIPPPFVGGFQQLSLSGDGQWLATVKQRDESTWEIGRLHTATGTYHPVITQGFRLGHVQFSPTDPLIFYVWETGGYAPQRTWLVQADGTQNRPFYARTDPKTWFTPLKEWITHEAWVKDTGDMTMINDKQGVMLVTKEGSARMIGPGDYWHAAARHDGQYVVLDDARGRIWLLETATGNTRLLATGIRDGVRSVHAHPSFDRLGRFVQFHSGRVHETVAWIALDDVPPLRP